MVLIKTDMMSIIFVVMCLDFLWSFEFNFFFSSIDECFELILSYEEIKSICWCVMCLPLCLLVFVCFQCMTWKTDYVLLCLGSMWICDPLINRPCHNNYYYFICRLGFTWLWIYFQFVNDGEHSSRVVGTIKRLDLAIYSIGSLKLLSWHHLAIEISEYLRFLLTHHYTSHLN